MLYQKTTTKNLVEGKIQINYVAKLLSGNCAPSLKNKPPKKLLFELNNFTKKVMLQNHW
jgi:hypothetical protein